MTSYKGMNRRLKDALVTILSAVQYDAGGGPENAFAQVIDNTHDEFEQSPTLRILPNRLASITGSDTQKDHTVSLSAIMDFPLQDPANIESTTYNQMYDLVDLVVDTIEHADYIGQLSEIDPLIKNWKMDVTQATLSLAGTKEGAALLCNINIELTYSKDVY